ncbi:MAG: hypothetical protein WCD37_06515 [Chloroflexia bacterium]
MADNVSSTTKLKQKKAIAALLTSKDIQGAARQAGVSERTLYRWLDEDVTFRADLQAAEAEAVRSAARRLAGAADGAVTVLMYVMLQQQNPAGVRLRAALGVLDQFVKLRQLSEIEVRLAALEERLSRTGERGEVT